MPLSKILVLFLLLVLAGPAFGKKFLTAKHLDGVSKILVVPIHWKQQYTVTFRGITVFGNRQEVAENPAELDIHACVSVGAMRALNAMPGHTVEILSAAEMQSYFDQIPRLGSGILGYAKKVMKLVVADHQACTLRGTQQTPSQPQASTRISPTTGKQVHGTYRPSAH